MQSQTLPEPTTPPASPAHYTVFIPGSFAWADRELTFPAPHTADEIARVIHADLTGYGYADIDVTVDMPAGMARIVWQGDPLDAVITGPGVGPDATELTVRERLAAKLHRIADDLVRLDLPVHDRAFARLNIGVLATRAELERWTEYLGSAVEIDRSGIQFTAHRIPLDDLQYGAELTVQAQVTKGGAQ